MAGSGGSYDPKRVRSEVRELQAKIDAAKYEADVAHLLSTALASANDRDADVIKAHLARIKQAIEKEVEGFVDLLFGGSVAKHTYVDGVSDVDALVVLNDSELSKMTPLQARDYFIGRLRASLPETTVEADGFAVAVKYSDGVVVELVPVKRQGQTYLLPSEDSTTWSRTRPRSFTDALAASNRAHNGKLIPTIKLAKVALTDLPEQRRPGGYHLEALAVDAFANYPGEKTPRAMLTHFFTQAAQRVLKPIADRTGQSKNVDDNLGPSGSVERQLLADSMGRIARRLLNADDARSVDQWKYLFAE